MEPRITLTDRLLHEEDGQDLVEYGLLLSLISLAGIIAVTGFGQTLMAMWDDLAAAIAAAF